MLQKAKEKVNKRGRLIRLKRFGDLAQLIYSGLHNQS